MRYLYHETKHLAGVAVKALMSSSVRSAAASLALLASLTASEAALAGAPKRAAQDWSEVKCERYKAGLAQILARRGTGGIGQEFRKSHDAFLASGCTARADVCPRSAEELEVANMLTIVAMNAGTASTFLPFACRK